MQGTPEQRIAQLEGAIRFHRDQRGDDRCWLDDEQLYSVLPEGYSPPVRDTKVELDLCKQFIQCRHSPHTTYISPQRRIEELEALVTVLEARITKLREVHPSFIAED